MDKKSFQRDLDEIRSFLRDAKIEDRDNNQQVYDYHEKGFLLKQNEWSKLSNDEVLAIDM